MTLPPQVASVRQARRFVVAVVTDSAVPLLADDAGLLASELAANAVLHARTDFVVSVDAVDGGVRVSVRDHSSSAPVLVAPSSTAMSGRGLALVRALADRWGAGVSSSAAKSVWFELVVSHPGPGDVDQGAAALAAELSVEELLAAWSDTEVAGDIPDFSQTTPTRPGAGSAQGAPGAGLVAGAAGEEARVVLPALVAVDLLAAKEAMEDVLRELQLILLGEGDDDARTRGVPRFAESAQEVIVARALDAAARDFADVRTQVRRQVSRAVALGQPYVVLDLDLGVDAARRASAYADAVQAAEQLAATGSLLSVADALKRHRAVRRAYLNEVIAAASR